MDRPFFCFLASPGSGNVVRIVNTAPVEFPMTASVVPHSINEASSYDAVLGGDVVSSCLPAKGENKDSSLVRSRAHGPSTERPLSNQSHGTCSQLAKMVSRPV